MGPDTDALLVGLICGPADLWPIRGRILSLAWLLIPFYKLPPPDRSPGKKDEKINHRNYRPGGQM